MSYRAHRYAVRRHRASIEIYHYHDMSKHDNEQWSRRITRMDWKSSNNARWQSRTGSSSMTFCSTWQSQKSLPLELSSRVELPQVSAHLPSLELNCHSLISSGRLEYKSTRICRLMHKSKQFVNHPIFTFERFDKYVTTCPLMLQIRRPFYCWLAPRLL